MNAPREQRSFIPAASEGGIAGKVDRCESCFAIGWAMQPTTPEERLSVELVVDGIPAAEAVADELREDVRAAGIGDGCYGFRIPLPHGCRDSALHRIDVAWSERPSCWREGALSCLTKALRTNRLLIRRSISMRNRDRLMAGSISGNQKD